MSNVRIFIYNKNKNGKASIKIMIWIIFNVMFNLLIKLYSNSNSFSIHTIYSKNNNHFINWSISIL